MLGLGKMLSLVGLLSGFVGCWLRLQAQVLQCLDSQLLLVNL